MPARLRETGALGDFLLAAVAPRSFNRKTGTSRRGDQAALPRVKIVKKGANNPVGPKPSAFPSTNAVRVA